MNFCEENELYISLYIDDQLDKDLKDQFLKHLELCPECSQKLKEETLFAQLCKEDEAFALPANFSESLHSKLIEISEKDNNKKKLLIFNKKAVAVFSSAAVVVISLLAYNLLPSMGFKMDTSSASKADEASQAVLSQDTARPENGFGDDAKNAGKVSGGEIKEIQPGKEAKESTADTGDTTKVQNSELSSYSFSVVLKDDSHSSENQKNGNQSQTRKQTQPSDAVEDKAKAQAAGEAEKEKVPSDLNSDSEESENIFMTMVEEEPEISTKYYSNYVEMDLYVTSPDEGMKKIGALMAENSAIEQKSGLINEFADNMKGISAYIDYVMPISSYSSIKSQALLKYNLVLEAKTDIIKKDITEEYINLENQRQQNQNNMNEALQAGGDSSAYEAEKSIIDKKMSALITNNDMITIRIFFVNK